MIKNASTMSSTNNNNKDDANNNANNNQGNANNKIPDLPEMPELPDLQEANRSVRSGISRGVRWMVDATNAGLAQLQHTADVVRKPVNSGLETLEHAGTQVATTGRITYERRHEFGPYWVLGSFVGVGGFFGLRRGKGPGVVLGSLAASLTYVALYEPRAEPPTFDWPFRDFTRAYRGDTTGSSNSGGDASHEKKKE